MIDDVDRVMRETITAQMATANKRAAAELAREERREKTRQHVETLPPVARSIGRAWMEATAAPVIPALMLFGVGVITGALITAVMLR
ncbi:hypothetical protein ACH54D_20650 [Atlantibacter hermannii]|uniref:hypothetical protein n=1 Tax=Atlantibacter hermannii TaxID=565 RepID=UPI00324C8546